jgi:hypothetical protein
MGKPYLKITFLKESQDKETPMKRISHDLLYLTLNQPKFHLNIESVCLFRKLGCALKLI